MSHIFFCENEGILNELSSKREIKREAELNFLKKFDLDYRYGPSIGKIREKSELKLNVFNFKQRCHSLRTLGMGTQTQ